MALDGHVRVLSAHVANKIAAGEVVERPASVVKELVENSLDAGSTAIKIRIEQGGRKLVEVSDDGSGMTKEDALTSLERQATSKISDVDDIENIATLGFRGEAIPSIASVSRFTLTTRRHDSDEGTRLKVTAGELVETTSAGTPPGTIIEVRDLFLNVPARRKFLRSVATEENHIKKIFTVHALAHPGVAFTLIVDGREVMKLNKAANLKERIADLFGRDTEEAILELNASHGEVKVSGIIEKPNLSLPTRRDQYVFVNSRPASAPSIQYALKEAYPSRQGDAKPWTIMFIELPPTGVDVNVHPTKREVRFRDNNAVKLAVMKAIECAMSFSSRKVEPTESSFKPIPMSTPSPAPAPTPPPPLTHPPTPTPTATPTHPPTPTPTAIEFAVEADSTASKPWLWFKFLAITDSGFLMIETDSGIVTICPKAARERIAFEHMLSSASNQAAQNLLIPEIVKLSQVEFSRIKASLKEIREMGFQLEEFGLDSFKIDAIPQLAEGLDIGSILPTIAKDMENGGARRADNWRRDLIARSLARAFSLSEVKLDEKSSIRLVEELAACKMPYVCPRGKPVMIFTSTRELNRKFNRD